MKKFSGEKISPWENNMKYEYYTQNIEKLLNNFCKKYGYDFSISTGYGREISYAILDERIECNEDKVIERKKKK